MREPCLGPRRSYHFWLAVTAALLALAAASAYISRAARTRAGWLVAVALLAAALAAAAAAAARHRRLQRCLYRHA